MFSHQKGMNRNNPKQISDGTRTLNGVEYEHFVTKYNSHVFKRGGKSFRMSNKAYLALFPE